MAVTSGFFNSVNHDRKYDANQFSTLFEGVFRDGVFASIGTSLVVTANAGMNINVGIGKAWFNNTWTKNDAILPLAVSGAEMVLNRIDAVVVEVDTTDSVRGNSIKVVKGVPGAVPVNPIMANTATVHQHPLCYIYVGAGAVAIIQANITNLVGTATCPFITGILETMTIDGITALLEAEFDTWFDGIQAQLSGNVAGNLQNQITTLQSSTISSYMAFCANISGDSLDAAFGKGISDISINLGTQLARYAWLKGLDSATNPLLELKAKNTYQEVISDPFTKNILINNSNLSNIVSGSPYARKLLVPSTSPLVIYHQGDEKTALTTGYVYAESGDYGSAISGSNLNGKLSLVNDYGSTSSCGWMTTFKGFYGFNRVKINITSIDQTYYYRAYLLVNNNRYEGNSSAFDNQTGYKTFTLDTPVVFGTYIGIHIYVRGAISIDHIEVWYE